MIKKSFSLLLLFSTLSFSSPKVVVTYFMTSFRCYSCQYMEHQTKEALYTHFAKEAKEGTISFRMIQIDTQENKQYIKKYQLENKSVVVSQMQGSSEVSWQRLDTLWEHIDQDHAFNMIVISAISKALIE